MNTRVSTSTTQDLAASRPPDSWASVVVSQPHKAPRRAALLLPRQTAGTQWPTTASARRISGSPHLASYHASVHQRRRCCSVSSATQTRMVNAGRADAPYATRQGSGPRPAPQRYARWNAWACSPLRPDRTPRTSTRSRRRWTTCSRWRPSATAGGDRHTCDCLGEVSARGRYSNCATAVQTLYRYSNCTTPVQ